MNTSTRLRQLADRMGLDGFAEELREIAMELEAKAAPAVPQSVIYEKADSLYKRGYTDRQTGKDYDPRGCDEWQEVVDWLTPAAPVQEPAVPQGWHISERKIDGQDAVIINGPMGGCVAYKDSDIPRVLPESILYELATAMLAATPAAPSQEPVAEQETLVGLSIHGKELRNENIVYDGGPLDLTDCKLLSCSIEFSKAAARTVQFLAIAEQSQPGFLQPLFADAVRLTKPSQEPVTPDLGQWCQYVAGMIFCWLQMQEGLGLSDYDEDRFVKAIAGIIQRRLWAYKPSQEPVTVNGIEMAAIGRKHFGNPIPREFYAAAQDIIAALREKEAKRAARKAAEAKATP